MAEALEPGKALVAYHEAQNFTRFYGSAASDQLLEMVFSFSNDEVDENGHWVTDENIERLNYDAEALKKEIVPGKAAQSGFLVTIFGRWLKVSVRNLGTEPTKFLRAYVRGSVF